jgi:hypothetical protein
MEDKVGILRAMEGKEGRLTKEFSWGVRGGFQLGLGGKGRNSACGRPYHFAGSQYATRGSCSPDVTRILGYGCSRTLSSGLEVMSDIMVMFTNKS